MKDITYNEFRDICAKNRVIDNANNLRADYSSYFENLPISVGGDNDKESYEIDCDTCSSIFLNGEKIIATLGYNNEVRTFTVSKW